MTRGGRILLLAGLIAASAFAGFSLSAYAELSPGSAVFIPDPLSNFDAAIARLLPLAIGYLIGSIPFGLLLTRFAGLGDIRAVGSGNIGATNVLRTGHKGLAA